MTTHHAHTMAALPEPVANAIAALVDHETFSSLDVWVPEDGSVGQRPDPSHQVVTGWAQIEGRPALVFAHWPSPGPDVPSALCEKIARAIDVARTVGVPVVGIFGGEEEFGECEAPSSTSSSYGTVVRSIAQTSGVVPQINVVVGPCRGAAAIMATMADFAVFGGDGALLELSASVTGGALDSVGGGASPAIADDRTSVAVSVWHSVEEAMEEARALLGYLPSNNCGLPERFVSPDPADRLVPQLGSVLPASGNLPYNILDVIQPVLDDEEFVECFAGWAKSIVCGFGRLNGHAVGIVANQPKILAGAIDITASEKAARFIRTCDCFGVPLVTFVDVPGFLPGIDQEHQGMIRRGAKLLYAYCEATVPRIQVVVRKGYGGAFVVMDSRSIGSDYAMAWPSAEVAVMGAEGAVEVIHKREIKESAAPDRTYQELLGRYRDEYLHPYIAAQKSQIDDVIAPEETRMRLVTALEMLLAKRESLDEYRVPIPPL